LCKQTRIHHTCLIAAFSQTMMRSRERWLLFEVVPPFHLVVRGVVHTECHACQLTDIVTAFTVRYGLPRFACALAICPEIWLAIGIPFACYCLAAMVMFWGLSLSVAGERTTIDGERVALGLLVTLAGAMIHDVSIVLYRVGIRYTTSLPFRKTRLFGGAFMFGTTTLFANCPPDQEKRGGGGGETEEGGCRGYNDRDTLMREPVPKSRHGDGIRDEIIIE